ncbi:hypothetical protein [Sphingomonas sp.]|uniref:hypothetical protein n=1 Tax=Sphingomonas sp. TaxID=28214 RepID=UPI003D6D5A15
MKQFLLAASTLPSWGQPDEQRIERYIWQCDARVELVGGTMTATRVIGDDGSVLEDSDSASWSSKSTIAGGLRYSVNWSVFRSHQRFRLSSLQGSLNIFVRRDHHLPDVSELRLQNERHGPPQALSALVYRGADKHAGRAVFPLSALLAYSGSSREIDWSMLRIANDVYGLQRPLASGKLPLEPLREAAAAIGQIEAKLDGLAASRAENCKRQPVYHDPDTGSEL